MKKTGGMGFSTCVQGRAAHEALLLRQDAEIRLMEMMKRCLATKVKCDREYALALSSVASQGMKMDRVDELSGSLVSAAWRCMIEEIDNTGKLIKQNADTVESKALERLNALHAEKRKARKLYQEEHNKILQRFTHLTEDVSRKRSEYQKYLELYKLMRSRFEEHYVKSGRGGRKLDETRDKYQKACRKLHLTHNEYVLLLCEASEYERDYHTVLLPGLLENQKTVQEAAIAEWKKLLLEIARLGDLTAEGFREGQRKVDARLEAVRPQDEYQSFNNQQQTTTIPATTFTFDDSLVDDTSGRLLANKLTVDNLTVEWLRQRQSELEVAVRQFQEGQQDGSSNGGKKESNETRCQERNMSRQLEMIRGALSELGCEEVPPGCDLTAIEQQQQVEINEQQDGEGGVDGGGTGSVMSLVIGQSPHRVGQRLADMLRKPFRRKSVPSSPVVGARSRNDRAGSAGPRGTAQQQQQLPTTPTQQHPQNNSTSAGSLCEEEWFHGVLPREEVVRLLTTRGDFLVRETTRNDECQIVLSVCWANAHKHFIVQTTAEGQYRFEGPAFPSVRELILHQHRSGLPVTGRSGAVLVRPIVRERWELNNDDVTLLDKIGRGNFGDVYKARLRNGEIVAAKTCRVALADEHKRKFLQEGRILKQYDHPNIVKLIGICVQKQPIMIVMELVPGGSLLVFLRSRSTPGQLSQKQLLKMCADTAAGMRYLESKNCIHRDLAARNCLVGRDNTVKISDFGMSREEEEYIVSDGLKQIPIKWTAPEALNFGKYTSLCDVWSYGVLVWEIFSKGSTPYPGMNNSQAREQIDTGYRMPATEGTPTEIHQLMLRCWQYQPEDRPHFDQICAAMDAALATATD